MKIGQRWYSESEPELGLGQVEEVVDRNVRISFENVGEERLYNIKTAPLKRLSLEIGDTIKNIDGKEFVVKNIAQEEDFLFYLTTCESIVSETVIHPNLSFTRPLQRILSGSFDNQKAFSMRYESLLRTRALDLHTARGYESSRVKILPHQASVFAKVRDMVKPKVILCDEVGLGKTIQAGLILKNRIERNLVKNCLIIVPEALQYQWFFELYKKFNLFFKTLGEESEESLVELDGDMDNTDFLITSFAQLDKTTTANNILYDKKWDAVIIDESHRIKHDTVVWDFTHDVVKASQLALFLTATPEALGMESFFARLHLLDPTKYQSFEEYQAAQDSFSNMEVNEKNISEYSRGRNYYRNTRKNLETFQNLFPKKTLIATPLDLSGKITDTVVINEKMKVLLKALNKNDDTKFLLIAKSKSLITKIKQCIEEVSNTKIAMFYKEQTLLEKDRQSAFFQDPDGAQILLSTEIGSEGRNFEFASNLFLFDLPISPAGLMQRIGRLDRIGQFNPISIHLPYIKGSIEESLFNLFNSFEIFTSFPKGINEFFENNQELITEYLKSGEAKSLEQISSLYSEFKEHMEKSSNVFLDRHSFCNNQASIIRKEINAFNDSNDLESYLESAFNVLGVDYERLNSEALFARPSDNMLIPALEGLSDEGMSYTLDRTIATHREDLTFVNWEAPLSKAILDLFTNSELGNTSIIKSDATIAQGLYVEAFFVLRGKSSLGLDERSFLPLTPIRTLIGIDKKDYTQKYSKRSIDASISDMDREESEFIITNLKKDMLAPLLAQAKAAAIKKADVYISKAKEAANEYFEIRLKELKESAENNLKAKIELVKLQTVNKKTLAALEDYEFNLDSIRIVF